MEENKGKIIDMITMRMDEMNDKSGIYKLHKVMELYCSTEQIIEAYKHAINTALYENENQSFSRTPDATLLSMLEILIKEE